MPLYPAYLGGYAQTNGEGVLLPDSRKRLPKAGDWRTSAGAAQVQRGLKRAEYVTPARVPEPGRMSADEAKDWGANSDKTRGLLNAVCDAIESGALTIGDLHPSMARRAEVRLAMRQGS